MQAVIAILLATFSGFGAVMFGASVLMEILKWRERWLAAQLNRQSGLQEAVVPPDQSSAATHQAQADPQHTESNRGVTPAQMS